MIHCPCMVDNQYFENTRLAHEALYRKDRRISYFQLFRALKHGKHELFGHKIGRITPRLVIGLPLNPDDDGADLVLQFPTGKRKPEHKPGEPLLRYPLGEDPISRGLPERWS